MDEVRIIETRYIAPDKSYIEAAGPSSATKPTAGIVSGSLFMESDTGDVYVFDETSTTWTQLGGGA